MSLRVGGIECHSGTVGSIQKRTGGEIKFEKVIYLIYLSTAIGLTPGGSGTVHTINT